MSVELLKLGKLGMSLVASVFTRRRCLLFLQWISFSGRSSAYMQVRWRACRVWKGNDWLSAASRDHLPPTCSKNSLGSELDIANDAMNGGETNRPICGLGKTRQRRNVLWTDCRRSFHFSRVSLRDMLRVRLGSVGLAFPPEACRGHPLRTRARAGA